MHREQWIVLLLGICALAADGFAAGIQYLDRRYVYGMPPEGVWEMFRFLAPYGLFAAGHHYREIVPRYGYDAVACF